MSHFPAVPLSETDEIFASNVCPVSSLWGLCLTFCSEEFGVLSPLDCAVCQFFEYLFTLLRGKTGALDSTVILFKCIPL